MDIEWNVEWVTLGVTVLIALVTGGWALLKMRDERAKGHREEAKRVEGERKQAVSLYVDPFLSAAKELQSRLYNILCNLGLTALRRRVGEGSQYRHAEETLFRVAQYFAYEASMRRYIPYSEDQRVGELVEQIRKDFSTDADGIDSWCIFRTQLQQLGQMVTTRQGEKGTGVNTISYLEFEKLVDDKAAKSLQLEKGLSELNNATSVDSLDGLIRLRLAQVQSDLVDLIEYIEKDLGRPASTEGGKTRERAYDRTCGKCKEMKRVLLENRPAGLALICHRHHKS